MSVCIRSTDNLREERDGKCTTKTLQLHFGSPKNRSNFCTIISSWNLFVTHIRSFPFICFVLPGTISRPEWTWHSTCLQTSRDTVLDDFCVGYLLNSILRTVCNLYSTKALSSPCCVFPNSVFFFLFSLIGILCLLFFMMFFTKVLDQKWSSRISTCF